MEPIPPVSGELAKLWNFLRGFDYYSDDEMRDEYLRTAKWNRQNFIENVDLLECFLASNPEEYVLRYTVLVVMDREAADSLAERAILHSVLDMCNQVLFEIEDQEK